MTPIITSCNEGSDIMLKTNLPVLVLHDVVLFPHAEIKLEIEAPLDKKIISLAENYYNNYT